MQGPGCCWTRGSEWAKCCGFLGMVFSCVLLGWLGTLPPALLQPKPTCPAMRSLGLLQPKPTCPSLPCSRWASTLWPLSLSCTQPPVFSLPPAMPRRFMRGQRSLEINPRHPLIKELKAQVRDGCTPCIAVVVGMCNAGSLWPSLPLLPAARGAPPMPSQSSRGQVSNEAALAPVQPLLLLVRHPVPCSTRRTPMPSQ